MKLCLQESFRLIVKPNTASENPFNQASTATEVSLSFVHLLINCPLSSSYIALLAPTACNAPATESATNVPLSPFLP